MKTIRRFRLAVMMSVAATMVVIASPLTDCAWAHDLPPPLFRDSGDDAHDEAVQEEYEAAARPIPESVRRLGILAAIGGLLLGGILFAIGNWKRALARRRRAKRRARQVLADTPYIHLHGRLR